MQVDAQLVSRAKAGDAAAFGMLYELIYKELCKYAWYVLGNEEDVKDAVSAAVLDAFNGIKSLKKPEAFGGWMFRILSAKCKQKLAMYANRPVEWNEANFNGSDCYQANKTNEVIEGVELEKAFKMLDFIDRQIVSMSVFAGFNSSEIAKILGMNSNTVRTRRARALEAMKNYLR